jgi:hypothetical protein
MGALQRFTAMPGFTARNRSYAVLVDFVPCECLAVTPTHAHESAAGFFARRRLKRHSKAWIKPMQNHLVICNSDRGP